MGLIKNLTRSFILPLSITLKIDKFILKRSRKHCCIVNFHGVRKLSNELFNNRHIKAAEFEKTIRYLKDTYNIVPLSQMFDMHRKGITKEKKTIALTFDDGYENNFSVALPILQKYKVPATFYIISKGLVNKNFFVWPDLVDIIIKYHKSDLAVKNVVFKSPSFYNEEIRLGLLDFLKTCGDKTEAIVADLASQFAYHTEVLDKSPELLELIRESEFKKYVDEPLLEFGSHTHSHFNLEYLDREKVHNELKESKKIIEQLIGKKVISLAFPDGSYTPETIDIAGKIGYTDLVAVSYKFNENNSLPNLLSRFTISNSTTFESNAIRLSKQFDKFGF